MPHGPTDLRLWLTRRQALASLSGGMMLLAAFDSEAAPLAYDLKPVALAEGAWMVPGAQEAVTMRNGGAIANVVILDTREGAVIVDTGPSRRYGVALEALARSLTGKPVVRVYLTHFHPDHVLGNQAFSADALRATAEVTNGLKRMGDDFASAMYRLAGDWMRGTEVVLPKETISAPSERIGERTLHLLPLSGHTDADLVIVDESSGLLIAGDLVFLDRAPTTPHADPAVWRRSLVRISELGGRVLVPGHGPAEAGGRGIGQTKDWLDTVEGLVRDAFERGLDINEAAALPLPAWTERIALARYELERTVAHLYPRLEAAQWKRIETETR